MKLELTSIGLIHTPHRQAEGTPIQPRWAEGIHGTVEVLPEFAPGLRDLDGFDRIWLLYWFDRARTARLEVVPYLDTQARGKHHHSTRPWPESARTAWSAGAPGGNSEVWRSGW